MSMEKKIPQVLLIGNGLNRAYGAGDWDQFLADLTPKYGSKPMTRKEVAGLVMPEPMKAIHVTNDRVHLAMSDKEIDYYGSVVNDSHRRILQKILTTGFDHILTTNYSYELEIAAEGKERITKKRLNEMATRYNDYRRVESRYLIHTCNMVTYGDRFTPIWHIHGEAKKPDSMILGHFYYGNHIYQLKKHCDKMHHYTRTNHLNIRSWIDAFILGDVHMVGFGCGFSEIDIWWLINRKKSEKVPHGGLFLYEPASQRQQDKFDLLKTMGCETYHLGYDVNSMDNNYISFYESAIDFIKNKR